MFDHVDIRVSDRAASEAAYDAIFAAIGVMKTKSDDEIAEWDNELSVLQTDAEHPVTRNLHIAWWVPSEEDVQRFWEAGLAAGLRDDGAPGPRPQYSADYYGGFLLDPDGNSVEAVTHRRDARERGRIDHLWIRVADLAATKRFYTTIAPHAGFELGHDSPERVTFVMPDASFSFVPGEPTIGLHIAFAAPDDATVAAFHRTALAAGYEDNGGPGERPIYHPGYFGAFVLDPDRTNVEAVNHNR
jgi:catechol 2,3-dioxygenase-like lactoylglutathione lyase family enzyme